MKTYDNKNISKKEINTILRNQNPTEIFRLVHHIYGGKVERTKVVDFIHEYAPSIKVSRNAWNIANSNKHDVVREFASNPIEEQMSKHSAMEGLKDYLKDTNSKYAKKPVIYRHCLCFCSPVYGIDDYNKWYSIPVKGNEKFCETIVRVAERYSNK